MMFSVKVVTVSMDAARMERMSSTESELNRFREARRE